MTKYFIIATSDPDDDDQPSELMDEKGQLTRQGNAVLYAIEKYGYSVDIKKADS